MIFVWIGIAIGAVLLLTFSSVLLFGAPYMPTLRPLVAEALDMADAQAGQHLVELGSGDGRVMLAAAQRGLRVTGYELNPILVLISRWRTRRYRKQVRVVWGNFWARELPATDIIFVFLLQRYMAKLDKKIEQELSGSVKLISFAFHIPGKKPARKKGGLSLYRY